MILGNIMNSAKRLIKISTDFVELRFLRINTNSWSFNNLNRNMQILGAQRTSF